MPRSRNDVHAVAATSSRRRRTRRSEASSPRPRRASPPRPASRCSASTAALNPGWFGENASEPFDFVLGGGPPRGTPAGGGGAHHVCVGRNASRYGCPPPSRTSAQSASASAVASASARASVPRASASARVPGASASARPPRRRFRPRPRPRSRLDRSRALHSAYSSFGGISARDAASGSRSYARAIWRAAEMDARANAATRSDVSLETSAERPSKLRRPPGGGFDPSPSRRRAEYPRLEEKPRDESSSAHAAATRKTHRACVSSAGAPPPAAATAPHAARISAATAHEASEGASRSSRPSGMSRRPSFTFPTEFRSFPPPPAPPPAPTPASSIV